MLKGKLRCFANNALFSHLVVTFLQSCVGSMVQVSSGLSMVFSTRNSWHCSSPSTSLQWSRAQMVLSTC